MLSSASASSNGQGHYFAALDGFRGVLAVFVAVYHTFWLSHPNSTRFFENGPVIIDLFFVFSGFLMFMLYAGKITDRASAKRFMVKRFARLYPLHLFMLMVFLGFALFRLWAHKVGLATHETGEILPFAAGSPDSWGNFLAHIFLLNAHGLSEGLTYNPPSWTIGAEFYTYFLFIAFMLFMVGKRFGAGLCALLLASIIVIYALLAAVKPDMNITYDFGFIRCVAGFFVGVLASRLFQFKRLNLTGHKSSALELAVLLGGIAFVIYCSGKLQFLVGPILFLFVFVFAHDGGAVSKVMSHRLFRYLGKISYSVYMIHVIIAIVFGVFADSVLTNTWANWNTSGFGGDFLLIAYLIVVIGLSHLSYHFIEVPGGKFVRHLFQRKTLTASA